MYLTEEEATPEPNGVFTYEGLSNKTRFLYIGEGLSVRISRLDINIARVYFVCNGREVPIPAQITLVNGAGEPTARVGDSFIIVWVDSYTMYEKGRILVIISNQRQQSISGPAGHSAGYISSDGSEVVVSYEDGVMPPV